MAHTHSHRRQSQAVPDDMRLLKHCPMCDARYDRKKIIVVEDHDQTRLMHMECQSCSSSVMSLVIMGPIGMSAIGMVTDLSVDDVRRLRKKVPISEEDLLGFHAFLRSPDTSHKLEEQCVRFLP